MSKLFKGTYTALITPFDSNDNIDWNALERLVENQIEGGVEGIVFMGTTGEVPTVSFSEHNEILRRSVKMVNGRCQVIHGTGSNCTRSAIEHSHVSANAGADGQLVVNPYYNKPTQEGLFQHFWAIANATDLPIIIYNIMGRTGVNLETETLLRLAEHKNIVSVKEASGDISQMIEVIQSVPKDFSVLVGDDALTLPFMASGGDGVVSVISNFVPQNMSDYMRICLEQDFVAARPKFEAMYELMRISFAESNPIPVKEVMIELGFCEPNFRLPLSRGTDNTQMLAKKAATWVHKFESVITQR